jgi:hypothetical protein
MMTAQIIDSESFEAVHTYTHSPYSFSGPEYHTRIVQRCDSPSSNCNRSRFPADHLSDNNEPFSSCDVSCEDLASLYRSSSSSSAHSTPRDSFKSRRDDTLPAALLHRRLEVIAKRYNGDEDNQSEPRSRASSQTRTPQSLSFIFESVNEDGAETDASDSNSIAPSISGEFSSGLSISDMLAPIQCAKAIVSRKGGCQKAMMKSKMCKHWLETQDCPYGARCAYAHGTNELRRKMLFWTKKTGVPKRSTALVPGLTKKIFTTVLRTQLICVRCSGAFYFSRRGHTII